MANNVVKLANHKDWKIWVSRINGAWQKTVDSILETGLLLIDAKHDLAHGEWAVMLATELNFGQDTAEKLMAIARHSILSNSAHARILPPSYETIYQLTKVDKKLGNGTLSKWLKDGTVNPQLQRKEILALMPATKNKEKKTKIPTNLKNARDAYIAAVKAENLTKEERVAEIRRLLVAFDLALHKDFGIMRMKL